MINVMNENPLLGTRLTAEETQDLNILGEELRRRHIEEHGFRLGSYPVMFGAEAADVFMATQYSGYQRIGRRMLARHADLVEVLRSSG